MIYVLFLLLVSGASFAATSASESFNEDISVMSQFEQDFAKNPQAYIRSEFDDGESEWVSICHKKELITCERQSIYNIENSQIVSSSTTCFLVTGHCKK